MEQITRNGKEYSFADISLNLLGRDVVGLKGIKYNTTRDHQNVIGKGGRPVAMSRGQKNFEGTLTLTQSEVELIQEGLAPGKDLTDLPPFPIVVSYAPEGGVLKTDILEKCRFRGTPKGMSSDDADAPVEMELAIFNIKYNA